MISMITVFEDIFLKLENYQNIYNQDKDKNNKKE